MKSIVCETCNMLGFLRDVWLRCFDCRGKGVITISSPPKFKPHRKRRTAKHGLAKPKLTNRIVKFYERGWTNVEIAEKLGVSRHVVTYHLKKHSLQ